MTTITPPTKPGEWSLSQIQETLRRPLPPSYLETLPDKGNAQYCPWYRVNAILDKYAPGWTWEIRQTVISSDRYQQRRKLFILRWLVRSP